MAEWSKAPRSGRGLSGGVGSNPTAVILFNQSQISVVKINHNLHCNKNTNYIFAIFQMKTKLNLFRINYSSVSRELKIKMVNSSTRIEMHHRISWHQISRESV